MRAPDAGARETLPRLRTASSAFHRKNSAASGNQRLRDLLQGPDCEVWLDADRIGGGASWSSEIESALTRCDVLVAVLTPGSYVSEICRAEQIWALEEGKVVIPVLAVAGAPVPIHLKSRQWRKCPEQQDELLADIATGVAAVPERCD